MSDSYLSTGARAFPDAYFGEGSGAVNLDFVQCSGSEYNLTDCETSNSGSRSSHTLDIGVKCEPSKCVAIVHECKLKLYVFNQSSGWFIQRGRRSSCGRGSQLGGQGGDILVRDMESPH